MTSNLRAPRREIDVDTSVERDAHLDPDPDPDLELEADVAEIGAWFEALPSELRAHLDREARAGREAYAWP